MGRQAQHTHALADGTEVGYSLTERPGGFRVRFLGPDGTRIERSTGSRTKAQARQAATEIITAAYRPVMPAEPSHATWEVVLAELESTPDLRPDSIRAYRTAVQAVRKVLPDITRPADITTSQAHRFKREYLAGTYTRGRASDAKAYSRSPISCTTYLRCLRSLWAKHLRPLGHVKDNPWRDVPYPNAPRGKRVRVPDEKVVTAFFAWLAAKHPGWDLLRLFILVKMLAGCRTIDLCKLRSADLNGDQLTMSAEVTKTRAARTVPLPADLAADLRRLAGPTWLWERSLDESKLFRPNPRMKSKSSYDPSTLRWTVQNLFKEFNDGRPGEQRFRPHDLRARAFTVVAAATQSVDATARAMGADPQTARHYLDAAKAFDGVGILKDAADLLRPKP